MIERGANIDQQNHQGRTPLHVSVQHSKSQFFVLFYRVFIFHRDSFDQAKQISLSDKLGMVKLLLEKNATVSLIDNDKLSPLFLAINQSRSWNYILDMAWIKITISTNISDKTNIVKELVSHPSVNSSINTLNMYGQSAIHYAIESGMAVNSHACI